MFESAELSQAWLSGRVLDLLFPSSSGVGQICLQGCSGIHKWSLRSTGPKKIKKYCPLISKVKSIPPWSYPDAAAAGPAAATSDAASAATVCIYYAIIGGAPPPICT